MAFRPAIFDADIFALEKTGLPKSVTKRSQIGGRFRWRTRTQESNYPYCLLLRGYRGGQPAVEAAITLMNSRRLKCRPRGSGPVRTMLWNDAITAGIYDRRN